MYLDNSYKNPFDRKMPQSQLETPFSRLVSLRLTIKFCFTKLAGVSIFPYVFSSLDLLIHKYLRFLATILLLHIVSCFVCDKWHRMRLYEIWGNFQKAFCHAEFSSASTRKRFQNEFGMTIFFSKNFS